MSDESKLTEFAVTEDGTLEMVHYEEAENPQEAALLFFRKMPPEALDKLGIEIVEGEHPGSSYFAAELRSEIDQANRSASNSGIRVRFMPIKRRER